MNIRRATGADAEIIAGMYNWYILNTIITFETEEVSPDEMKERIYEKLVRYDWIVGQIDHEIIGYAYYGPFRPRAAYNHTVESTIYLSQKSTGKGFGKRLYADLIESAKDRGFREVIGVIALPNPPSLTLHRETGFQEVGVLKNVGYKFRKYIDVALWQRSLA
jgi:phosphinothricin acetyltransferase